MRTSLALPERMVFMVVLVPMVTLPDFMTRARREVRLFRSVSFWLGNRYQRSVRVTGLLSFGHFDGMNLSSW